MENFKVHTLMNKEVIVDRKIDFVNEDGSVIKIKKGEQIKIIGHNFEEYYYLCEYNGTQFTCVDIFYNKEDWKIGADPETDILVKEERK